MVRRGIRDGVALFVVFVVFVLAVLFALLVYMVLFVTLLLEVFRCVMEDVVI